MFYGHDLDVCTRYIHMIILVVVLRSTKQQRYSISKHGSTSIRNVLGLVLFVRDTPIILKILKTVSTLIIMKGHSSIDIRPFLSLLLEKDRLMIMVARLATTD